MLSKRHQTPKSTWSLPRASSGVPITQLTEEDSVLQSPTAPGEPTQASSNELSWEEIMMQEGASSTLGRWGRCGEEPGPQVAGIRFA